MSDGIEHGHGYYDGASIAGSAAEAAAKARRTARFHTNVSEAGDILETDFVRETEQDKAVVVAQVSRQQVEQARAEREKELQRLAAALKHTSSADGLGNWSGDRKRKTADLLAFLGQIHDTPNAKFDWIG